MKYSVDQVVEKLQQLVNRMRSHENTVDKIINVAIETEAHLCSNNICQADSLDFGEFSKRLSTHPRGQLILCLAAENKQLQQLFIENCTLCESLDEHQAALDIIMSKYREQMTQLMRTNQLEQMIRKGSIPLQNRPDYSSECSKNLEVTASAPVLSTGMNSTHPPTSAVVKAQPVNVPERSTISTNSATRNTTNSTFTNPQLTALASLALDISEQGDAYAIELEEELHRLRSENAGLREMLAISSSCSNDVGGPRSNEAGSSRSLGEEAVTHTSDSHPGPPLRMTDANSDNWPFESPSDRSTGVSNFLNALKAHSNDPFRFPSEFLSSPEEDEDEDDSVTATESNDELEVDIGRDTRMINHTNE